MSVRGVLFLIGLCLLAFGGITLYGSTAPNGQSNWIPIGVALGAFGVLVIAGGAGMTLSAKDITLSNGAPMVNCPYCHTIYQLIEEPKW
jgi:hypothetical protein